MTIKQISIFIENKSGALLNILKLLRDNGISIIISNISDTADFGIYRLICSDTEKAFAILRDKGINATIANVYAIRLADNKVGAAADVMTLITEAGVGIKYMFSFLLDGKGVLLFRADDEAKANEVIMLNKLDFLNESDLH
ncbi:MAG: amino acid-binding protein [Prevotella sp.]|nr:amino acid-binding protein [Prevotella sp.]MBQ9237467.1 amino acid-binding protein [Prevotella sp.]MBQ9561094.1 amino acid-binding protein [Prevotella sp.]